MKLFSSRAGGRLGQGQYRSGVFVSTKAQEDIVRPLIGPVPMMSAHTPEAVFWSAEDYHQKFRLRRSGNSVALLEEHLGPHWDEHVWATKLNAKSEAGFNIKPWLEMMPGPLQKLE